MKKGGLPAQYASLLLAAAELVDEIDVILLMRVFKPEGHITCAHEMVSICLFSKTEPVAKSQEVNDFTNLKLQSFQLDPL